MFRARSRLNCSAINPANHVEHTDGRLDLQVLLGHVRVEEREVLFLHRVEGFTASENAKLTEQSRGTKYRLVAFRSHSDECPHCRATGELFAALQSQLKEESIGLEQFDLSDTENRDQIDSRIRQLHVTELIEGQIETAFLALVNSSGETIQEYKPSMNSDRIANVVRRALKE